MEIAPSSWVDRTKLTCLWPPGPAAALIKACRPPKENWSAHKIKIYKTAGNKLNLHKTFRLKHFDLLFSETYKEARKLLLQATVASGLDTTDAEDVISAKKKKLVKISTNKKRQRPPLQETASTSSESASDSEPDPNTRIGPIFSTAGKYLVKNLQIIISKV